MELTERDRKMLEMRDSGMSQKAIGREFGMDRQKARRTILNADMKAQALAHKERQANQENDVEETVSTG